MGEAIQTACGLRKSATETEERAWWLLRNRRLTGLKFRRQHPIGRYVVDFYCVKSRLAVELDGSVHAQPSHARKDAAKDAFLRRELLLVLSDPVTR